MTALALRRARPDDAPAILELKRRAYAHYVPRIGAEPMPMRADYARFIAEDEVWLQEGDDGPVACLVLQSRPDHLMLWSVAVAPEIVGHGFGHALLGFVEERARAHGVGEIRLFTNERMVENRAWYSRHGYRETHVERHENRRIVHMSKRLDAAAPLGDPVDPTPARRPERIVLDGRAVRVVPLDPAAHAEALYPALHGPEGDALWRYMSAGPFPDRDAFREWLEAAARVDDPLVFALVDARTGEPNGLASYMRIEPAQRVIEVGGIIYSPALSRTIGATEAMYLLARQAFEDLGYRRYEWKCNALNDASRRAALRLGFTYEGTFRQHMIVKGRNRDTAWFAMLDAEWPAVRARFERWLAPQNFDDAGRQRVSLSAISRRPPRMTP